MQISLSDVCCVWCCSEAGSPRIALQAPRSLGHGATSSSRFAIPPVVLQFSGDADMEDWLAYLTSGIIIAYIYNINKIVYTYWL